MASCLSSSTVFMLLVLSLLCSCEAFGMQGMRPLLVGSRTTYRPLPLLAQREQQQDSSPSPQTKRKKATKRDMMLEQILESVDYTRSKLPPQIPLSEDPLLPMVQAIALAADKRKAGSINAFRISHITEITTFMVVIEGNSRPQNQAIALAIEDDVLVAFTEQPSKEGDAASGWILLDYGNVIVHIMTPQMRNFYKLEKRWKDAEVFDLTKLLAEPRRVGQGQTGGDDEGESSDSEIDGEEVDAEDPFWQ